MEKGNENKGNILYVLNTLKKYSDDEHILSCNDIKELIKKDYDVNIDSRTIRRNINLLIEKFGYDISTYNDNRKGYYYIKNIDIDFTLGEITMLVDMVKSNVNINNQNSNIIISKLKKRLSIYEIENMKSNVIMSKEKRTKNFEIPNSIEEISQAIQEDKKIQFTYNRNKIEFSPKYIVYNNHTFYVSGVNNTLINYEEINIDDIEKVKILNKKRDFKSNDTNIRDYIVSSSFK